MPRSRYPSRAFAKQNLVVAVVPAGESWRRLYASVHPDPLGFEHFASRFSDPAGDAFGVVYLGSTVKVACVETIIRDRGEGRIGQIPIPWAEFERYTCAEIEIVADLRLADLCGDAGLKMGVPTDVARAKSQTLARRWSRAFHAHPANVDGVVYSSRLNEQRNIALYDRALAKVRVVAAPRLVELRDELAALIDDFELAIV